MITKNKLSLVLLSAILLSACNAKTPANNENQGNDDSSNTQTEQTVTSSIRELIGMGQNQKCNFTVSATDKDDNTIDTSGTIYLSGNKFAEEVQTLSSQNEALNTNMRMISDGTYMYTWDTSKKMPGMKFKIVEPTETDNENTTAETQKSDIDSKIDMKCAPWSVDEAMFTIPTDVQFNDLSEMMKNLPTMPANIPTIPANIPIGE